MSTVFLESYELWYSSSRSNERPGEHNNGQPPEVCKWTSLTDEICANNQGIVGEGYPTQDAITPNSRPDPERDPGKQQEQISLKEGSFPVEIGARNV
jgi:hypothetical protein